VPLETFTRLGGTETVADIDVEAVVLATADESELAAVARDVEATGATLDGPFRQASVTSLGEVRGIPFYLAGFTAFIGTLSVFHTLFVTSRRRRVDLAVLRALGCRPRQAGGVINWQGFFLGLASFVIGCPLGIVTGRLLWTSIVTNTNVLAVIDTPWMLIVGFGVLVLVSSSFVLAAGPAWTARRRSPGIDLRAE
jgi:ABC-type antimicrobial peptide transport system permease subunit